MTRDEWNELTEDGRYEEYMRIDAEARDAYADKESVENEASDIKYKIEESVSLYVHELHGGRSDDSTVSTCNHTTCISFRDVMGMLR